MTQASPVQRAAGRRTLLLLLAAFAVPLAAAFALYYGVHWRPDGQTNHGALIQPPRPLPHVQLPRFAAEPAAASAAPSASTAAKPGNDDPLRGRWSFLYVGGGRCDAACRRALLVMRQTRLSLNREMDRVGRTWLATTECCDRELLRGEHAGVVALDATGARAAPLLDELAGAGAAPDVVFVVDPLGNLVMRYDARQDPKGLLEDVKKLLKLSHIG